MKVPVIKKEKQFAFIEDEPITPNGTDVLIEVRNVGICGSDIHYWDIGQPEGLILGHEFSGLVLDPGNRKDLKIKDRVTALPISPCNTCPACKSGNVQYCEKTWSNAVGLSSTYKGAFSKLIKVRPDMVVKIPNNVSFEHAALTEPLAVSLHATNLVNITKNDKVLVIGAGRISKR